MVDPIATTTADHWTLRGDRRGRGRAVLVLGHAMLVDRRTFDRPRGEGMASFFAEAGYEVLCFDARGHGESGPRAEMGGRWDYDDIVRFDVPAMVACARKVARGRPVALVGHSLIGHAALIHAGLEPEASSVADAIVALAPNLWAPWLEPSWPRRRLKAAMMHSWVAGSRAFGFFDPRPFGLGTNAEPLPYLEHFLAMWTRDRLESRDGRVDYQRALAAARVPVLGYSSERDTLFARPPCADRFLALMRHADVEHRVWTRRDAYVPTHAGFVVSPRSRPVWEAVDAWLQAKLRPG